MDPPTPSARIAHGHNPTSLSAHTLPAHPYAPFTRPDYPLTIYEHLKCTLCLITITPIRLIVSVVSLLAVYLGFLVLFRIVWRGKTCINDLSQRQFAVFSRIMRVVVRFALFLWGFYWMEVVHVKRDSKDKRGQLSNASPPHQLGQGEPAPESSLHPAFLYQNGHEYHLAHSTLCSPPPFIIISNHLSLLDVFFCLNEFGPVSFLSRHALLKIPFFNKWMHLINCLFVRDDETSEGKKKLVAHINERQAEYYEKVSQLPGGSIPPPPSRLVIFPEGTTTNGQYLISFHKGAFAAGEPVQPMFVHHPFEHFSPSWETIPLSVYIFRLACQFYNRVQIYHLPIYYPSEEEKGDPHLYSRNVRQWMKDTVNKQTSHFYLETIESTRKDKTIYHSEIVKGLYRWNELPWERSAPTTGYRKLPRETVQI